MDMLAHQSSQPNNQVAISRFSLFQRVPNLDQTRTKRLKAFNRIGAILLSLTAIFWGVFWIDFGSPLMTVACSAFAFVGVLTYFLGPRLDSHITFLILVLTTSAFIVISVFVAGGVGEGRGGGPHAFLLTMATLVYFILMGRSRLIQIGTSAFIVLLFLIIELQLVDIKPVIQLPQEIVDQASYINWAGALLSIAVFFVWLVKDAYVVEQKLNLSNTRFEELLHHILPENILNKLSAEGATFAEYHADCSIMFADIVNFEQISSEYSAEYTVSKLNQLFSLFDDAVHESGAEKIKTIGSGYMVAAGLPNFNSEHALVLVKLAIKLKSLSAEFPELQVRFGINSGPVTAGIIGKQKVVYDVWGDTVNVAARLDKLAKSGCILISETTLEKVRHHFQFEFHGLLNAKGIGELKAFEIKSHIMAN